MFNTHNNMRLKMRNIAFMLLSGVMFFSFTHCNGKPKSETNKSATEQAAPGVIKLTAATFKEQVFDYSANTEWAYKGSKPAILDFYADWCGPCKMLAPHLEAIQKEYGGDVQVYKINTDEQRELAGAFGIQSLPTIVFVPMSGQPQAVMGYRAQADLEQIITEVLKVQKPASK
jgi:thioredoxin 1